MIHPHGKNIIFGKRFEFKTEIETNIVTNNFIPIEREATVFDDFHINKVDFSDYITELQYQTDFKKYSENLTTFIIELYNNPKKINNNKVDFSDYITELQYQTDFKKYSENLTTFIIELYNNPKKINNNKVDFSDYITENVTVTLDQVV